MPIYDIFEHVDKRTKQDDSAASHISLSPQSSEFTLREDKETKTPSAKHALFTTIAARLFFLMLLFVDIAWGFFSLVLFICSLIGNVCTGFKLLKLKKIFQKKWLNIKRSLVCGLSLFVAIISPALGTMFACTYFLMYDKKGIEEVVPSILQDQFKEFFKT